MQHQASSLAKNTGDSLQCGNRCRTGSTHGQIIRASDLLFLVFGDLNRLIAAHRADIVTVNTCGPVIEDTHGVVLLGVLEKYFRCLYRYLTGRWRGSC